MTAAWLPRLARAASGPAAVTVAATALLAGCSEVDTDLDDKARSTVATLLQACSRGEGEAAVDLLTPPAREELIGAESVVAGCDRVLDLGVESELEARTVFAEAVVEEVMAGDGFGTATIRAPDGETSEVELESVGDAWLVSNPTA